MFTSFTFDRPPVQKVTSLQWNGSTYGNLKRWGDCVPFMGKKKGFQTRTTKFSLGQYSAFAFAPAPALALAQRFNCFLRFKDGNILLYCFYM